jgi:hypothetical protein
MKTINFFLVIILATTFIFREGVARTTKTFQTIPNQQPGKEKIKQEDLPEATLKTLKDDAFKGWTIVQAYQIKNKDTQGKEIAEYQVEVKKDNVTQLLKFDKDGNAK